MKRTENISVKIILGTGMLALISLGLMAGVTLSVLNGLFPEKRLETICYILHFVSAYIGCLICCSTAKEKKGIYAGLSVAAWYVLLLFISVVILDCSVSNIVASVGLGACGYGAALLTCLAPKHRKSKRVKFPSR